MILNKKQHINKCLLTLYLQAGTGSPFLTACPADAVAGSSSCRAQLATAAARVQQPAAHRPPTLSQRSSETWKHSSSASSTGKTAQPLLSWVQHQHLKRQIPLEEGTAPESLGSWVQLAVTTGPGDDNLFTRTDLEY